MLRLILPLVYTLLMASCGGGADTAAELEGTWTLAPDFLEEMLAEVPEERRDMAKAAMEKLTMAFQDGKCTAELPGKGSQEGTYTVTKVEGKDITVETVMGDTTESQVITIDGGSLSITRDGYEMKFVRRTESHTTPPPADR